MDDIKCEADFTAALEAIERMNPKGFKRAVKRTLRQGGVIIRKAVQKEVKRLYPGAKKYKRNPNREPYQFKGVTYGPLYKDVKLSLFKNAKGVNVSLFSQKKDNRWMVLHWLDQGTQERGNQGTSYEKTKKSGYTYRHYNGQYRKSITGKHFFSSSSSSAVASAKQTVIDNMCKNVIAAFNKEIPITKEE